MLSTEKEKTHLVDNFRVIRMTTTLLANAVVQ